MKLERRSVFGWGATAAASAPCTSGIVIHYDGSNQNLAGKAHTACRDYWRRTRTFHIGPARRWVDIGYSFGVCPHGVVLEGRGVRRAQAAQPGGNTTWTSVTLMGGPSDSVTPEQIEGVRQLRAWLRQNHGLSTGVRGHRQFVSTSCPGNTAYALVTNGTFAKAPGSSVPEPGTGGGGSSTPYEAYNRTAKPGDRVLRQYSVGDDVKAAQKAVGAEDDGYFGPNTVTSVRAYQSRHGLSVDGVVGPQTWGRILGSASTPKPSPVSSSKAPPWPGPYLSHPPLKKSDTARRWQSQMRARGWRIDIDGWYGPASKQVCLQFQREKKLKADGVVGPATWRAAWESPIT